MLTDQHVTIPPPVSTTDLGHLDRLVQSVEEVRRSNLTEAMYEIAKLRSYRDALFEHFAPFQTDDRVRLRCDYPVSTLRSPSWLAFRPTLREGATAVVRQVDWHAPTGEKPGAFSVAVVFDEEILEHRAGAKTATIVRTGDQRRLFHFRDAERWWQHT